jgi:hypothetical protein
VREEDLGHGNRILGFESLEEMIEYQAQQEAELAQRMAGGLPDEQEGISYGSYALRLVPTGDKPLVIFGRVAPLKEFAVSELEHGADLDELVFTLTRLRDLHERGYRYGTWYSTVCPDGEVGDAHVTTLWPITEADYQHALNNRWECPRYLYDRVLAEMEPYMGGAEE